MRETRLYSLFELQNGKWVRVNSNAFRKSSAVRIFQSALLASFLHGAPQRKLRVVKQSQ